MEGRAKDKACTNTNHTRTGTCRGSDGEIHSDALIQVYTHQHTHTRAHGTVAISEVQPERRHALLVSKPATVTIAIPPPILSFFIPPFPKNTTLTLSFPPPLPDLLPPLLSSASSSSSPNQIPCHLPVFPLIPLLSLNPSLLLPSITSTCPRLCALSSLRHSRYLHPNTWARLGGWGGGFACM